MRIYALWLMVAALCVYAQKDYFKVALVLVMFMAIYGHPDMPTNLAGIQGVNPWNLLALFTLIGYASNKKKEGAAWDLDGGMTFLFILFLLFGFISSTRLLMDMDTLDQYGWNMTRGDAISEYYINQNKWLIPAYLIFVGARTPERRKLALAAICATYLLIALIVLRRIPLSSVSSGMELTQRGLKVLEQAFGWSRVNTATVLAGGAWAIYLSTNFLTNGRFKWLPLGLFGLSSISLALTGGRMGYGAWAAIGGIFSAWRWRKGILLLPLAMALVLAFVPSVQQRLLQGISTNSGDTEIKDASELTSGRTDAWPVAIDRISASPWFGYGRHAMVRTGASAEVARREGLKEGERGFPHPHNMYLRIMMDSGLIGTVPILLMYLIILKRSASICRYKKGEAASIGMATLSLVLALLIAGLGSQDVFPVQGTIAMWASVALALRVHRDMVLGVYQAPELMTEPAEETVQAKPANAANEPEPLWEKARGDAARSRYL